MDPEHPVNQIPYHLLPHRRAIREFQNFIQVPEYDPVIERVLTDSYERGITIVLEERPYYRLNSVCETTEAPVLPSGYRYTLRIKSSPVFQDMKKETMFDILHELGHVMDPNKLPSRDPGEDENSERRLEWKRRREIQAWKWVDAQLVHHPELHSDQNFYLKYRRHCLTSYKVTPKEYNSEKLRF